MILQPKDNSIVQNLLFQQLKALISVNRSQVQNQSPSTSLHSLEYQSFMFNQYQMISRQNEFLEQIKQQIAKKKSSNEILFCGSNSNPNDILPMENSFDMSNISSVQGFDDEPFKTKFGEEFQKSLLSSALNQVHQNCSSEAYEAIKGCVLNTKQKEFESLSQKHQKLTKKHEELETSFIIKSTQLTQCEIQLKQAQLKIDQFQQEKRKLKVKSNQLSQKQKRLYKLQTTLIFKQKLFHEGKKRYQRQKSVFLGIQQRLNGLYKKMQQIWGLILTKMQSASSIGCLLPCDTNNQQANTCWKKDVMKKCRQQLIDQRDLLKQQEQQMQKRFDMIEMLSDQVQKIVNQKQTNNGNSDPFVSEQSSIVVGQKH